mmetsp:Transcript_27391/g.64182  ORF Transcript_27391/g.64182 Transcript_27391/m.64182 type:complete len:110 (-) Transcript_27391:2224-2553(-)
MKISALCLTLFLVGSLLQCEGQSFARDVMGMQHPSSTRPGLDEMLREKAIPLNEYKKRINAKGLHLGGDGDRHLEEEEYEYDEYEYSSSTQTCYCYKFFSSSKKYHTVQ